jgi:hypothetical protein
MVRSLSAVLLALACLVSVPVAQQTCTISASSTEFNVPFERAGGPGLIRVTASTPTCAWTASPTVPWITITGATTGNGSAFIPFEVAALPAGTVARSGGINVGSGGVGVHQGIGGVIGAIESPTPGTYVVPFTMHGWGMADNGTSNTAVVDVYTGFTADTFVGSGTMGQPRQHIADRWGPAYLGSGYSLEVSSLAPGSYTLRAFAKAAPNSFYWTAGSVAITVVAPALSLSVSQVRATLTRGTMGILAATDPQPVIVSGIGKAAWTATPQQPWIVVSPSAGTGDGRFIVSVNSAHASIPAGGLVSGTIRVTAAGVPGGTIDLPVHVTVLADGRTAGPFGAFETPTDGAIGLNGAFALTGWALDDVGVRRVMIYRDPVPGEVPRLIYVGDAPRVEGARPDVAATFPEYPSANGAGWGYMLLSNMLPNQGNGTFTFHVFAQDSEGFTPLLGKKTVTIDNAAATSPFGTLDFPAQGEVVSGVYTSMGWVLTPQPATLRPDGSVCGVFIDGQFVGRPLLGLARPDVAGFFPGLNNTGASGGKYTFDTRHLKNGIHTIAWSVQDNMGRVQGIGSRYFIVNNP